MTQSLTILDGGMGRLLERMGAPFKQPEWSAQALIEAPETVLEAHKAFIQAGADVITTNAYAVVPFHIGEERFYKDGADLLKLSAKLARQAAAESDRGIQVAGCIPPVFGSYRPDLFDKDTAAEIYKIVIEAQTPYVDFWLAETVSNIEEAVIIKEVIKDHNDKDFWLAYTLLDREDNTQPPQLRSGESIRDAVRAAINLEASALLFNCSQIKEMSPTLEMLQSLQLDIPYGAYANAFPPREKDVLANGDLAQLRDDITPAIYKDVAREWQSLGARIIGGCCGIMPEHIEKLAEMK